MAIPAVQFKAQCLKFLDQVEKNREPIVITKRGRPVAQLSPVPTESGTLFGYMASSLRIKGDVRELPGAVEWSALSGEEDHLYNQPVSTRARRKK